MNFVCNYCPVETTDLDKYFSHILKHKNVPNFKFCCPICIISYTTVKSFRSHIYRSHNDFIKKKLYSVIQKFVCLSCELELNNITQYKLHLLDHISNEMEIKCNINECQSSYSKISSFNSHFYRNHSNFEIEQNIELVQNQTSFSYENPNSPDYTVIEQLDQCSLSEVTATENYDFKDDFRNQITAFILKMEAKLLVPKSAIQVILDTIMELIDTNNKHQLAQFLAKIPELDAKIQFPIAQVEDILDNNLFETFLGAHGDFRSQYMRSKFFTNNANYVEPIKLLLGRDSMHKECFAYYVPIKDSLRVLLSQDQLLEKALNITPSNTTILKDLEDGYVVKRISSKIHPLHKLNIILYQDAFEICNPLGSSKKKHKVIGMYYRLNILNRSNIDNIQIVLLTYDKYLKIFSQEQVFGVLVNDLKDLEENGLIFENNVQLLPFVSCMAGDNLGSHYIAGMTENFSSAKFFCRYCEISRDTFEENPLARGVRRTITENDKNIIVYQETNDLILSKGMKNYSVFNKLKYFNTVWGLPPCLAHDISEGIGAYDISFILNHYISNGDFTAAYLNNSLEKLFKLLPSTSYSSYTFKSKRLSGNGTQNMYFILFLPLAISEKIEDKENDVWQMLLTLNKIMQLVLSNNISIDETDYLQYLIEKYIDLRKQLFTQKLRPKHHYLLHYDELIRAYGPLINVWTFRFEQKHKFFKNIVRHCPNFINVLYTLTEKHQLYQSYLSLAPKDQGIITPFSEKLCQSVLSDELKLLVFNNDFIKGNLNSLNISSYVKFNGYVYKRGQSVCVMINEKDDLIAIRIQYILFENNCSNLIFVGPKEVYKYLSSLNCFVYESSTDNFQYVSLNDLKTEKCIIKYKNNSCDKIYALIQHF